MARPGVTYFEVAKAAAQLREQNQRPSIEAVRHVLGTGSNSTINKHLREWRKHHGNALSLEQGLPESLLVAVKGIYDAIGTEANGKLEAFTETTHQRLADLNAKTAALEASNQILQQEKLQLEKKAQTSHEENLSLDRLLHKANKTLHQKTAEKQSLTEKLQDRMAEIKRLTGQINHFQANLDHYRDAMREERIAEKQVFETERVELNQQLKAQAKKAHHAETQVIRLNQVHALLQSEKKAIEMKLAALLEKYQALEIDYQKVAWHNEQLQTTYDKRNIEFEACMEASKHGKSQITALTMKLEAQQAQLKASQKALDKAEAKLIGLNDKTLFLTQEKAQLAGQLKQLLSKK